MDKKRTWQSKGVINNGGHNARPVLLVPAGRRPSDLAKKVFGAEVNEFDVITPSRRERIYGKPRSSLVLDPLNISRRVDDFGFAVRAAFPGIVRGDFCQGAFKGYKATVRS